MGFAHTGVRIHSFIHTRRGGTWPVLCFRNACSSRRAQIFLFLASGRQEPKQARTSWERSPFCCYASRKNLMITGKISVEHHLAYQKVRGTSTFDTTLDTTLDTTCKWYPNFVSLGSGMPGLEIAKVMLQYRRPLQLRDEDNATSAGLELEPEGHVLTL